MLNKRKGALSDAPTLSWSRVSFSSSPLAANSQVMVRGPMAVHRGQREREGEVQPSTRVPEASGRTSQGLIPAQVRGGSGNMPYRVCQLRHVGDVGTVTDPCSLGESPIYLFPF